MISLTPILSEGTSTPLYTQLFRYIRDAIVNQDIQPGDKLPSLRTLSRSLNISVTTVELAYNQLLGEGYINSRARSGYYVSTVSPGNRADLIAQANSNMDDQPSLSLPFFEKNPDNHIYLDAACFDFTKWKKCINRILNDYSSLLLVEGDIQEDNGCKRAQVEHGGLGVDHAATRCDNAMVAHHGAGGFRLKPAVCLHAEFILVGLHGTTGPGLHEEIRVEEPHRKPLGQLHAQRALSARRHTDQHNVRSCSRHRLPITGNADGWSSQSPCIRRGS